MYCTVILCSAIYNSFVYLCVIGSTVLANLYVEYSARKYINCMYLLPHLQKKGETAQDNISARDAMFYPIYASVALFGLYIFFKFVPKEYVNIALSLFFFAVCVAGLARLAG